VEQKSHRCGTKGIREKEKGDEKRQEKQGV